MGSGMADQVGKCPWVSMERRYGEAPALVNWGMEWERMAARGLQPLGVGSMWGLRSGLKCRSCSGGYR